MTSVYREHSGRWYIQMTSSMQRTYM